MSHAFHSPLMEPMLEEFAEVVGAVSYRAPKLTMVSALSGGVVSDEVTDPAYWVRHVREAVRFSDAVGALRGAGVQTFIEIGPDGVLSGLGPQTRVESAGEEAAAAEVWLPVLRRGRDEPRALLTALAKAFVRGVAVGWDKVYAGTGARRVDLPTYAFQRQRYWLNPTTGSRAEDLGLGPAAHPLLGAAVELPATGGVVLTGQLSVSAQPWLAQSLVAGRVVLPSAALMDMAVRAGDEVGCERVEELVVEMPLVLPERGGVRVQVTVGEAGRDGRRDVAVFARVPEGTWVRHASGTLTSAHTPHAADTAYIPQTGDTARIPQAADTAHPLHAADAAHPLHSAEPAYTAYTANATHRADGATIADTAAAGSDTADAAQWSVQWPPTDAVAADVDELYARLAATGLGYGPLFQAVRAAWRRGDELFAEVALAEGTEVSGFGVHPALLDAALHVTGLERAAGRGPLLPLGWSDVTVHASGALAARVRVAPSASGEAVSVTLADAAGQPIASVGSVAWEPASAGMLDQAAGPAREGLFRVEWAPAAAVPAAEVPGAGDPGRRWAVLGEDGGLGVPGAAAYADVAELVAAVEAGAAVPDVVVTCCVSGRKHASGAADEGSAGVAGAAVGSSADVVGVADGGVGGVVGAADEGSAGVAGAAVGSSVGVAGVADGGVGGVVGAADEGSAGVAGAAVGSSVGVAGVADGGVGGVGGAAGQGFRSATCAAGEGSLGVADAADGAALHVLHLLGVVREWLGAGVLDGSRLVVVTERGVDAGPGADVRLDGAGVTGLVRAAAGEHPERIVLADVETLAGSGPLVMAGTALGEPEFAVREAQVRVPRLARASGDGLALPGGPAWRLGISERGTVENLVLEEHEDGRRALAAGEVRVAVRAAGVNFRDVLNVLDMYPGEPGPLGLEGAGVVLETGPGVVEPAAGDMVMGLFQGAFAPVVVADARTVRRVPSGWSVAEAAGAPVAFLTAYHALVELAGLRRGERVLIHAAAGGVGMAAVQVARHLGAEVFATASPSKWAALRDLGLDERHMASSRTKEFEEAFRAQTGGRGMDVVLDSLAGELVDASLRLTRPGGRFVELGRTDVRDPEQVLRDHAVVYRTFDLLQQDPDAVDGMLSSLSGLFAEGALRPLPVACWDVRRAGEALRFLTRARHVGKVVLTVPAVSGASRADRADRAGTVLVTGASGALGGLVARHLAATGRARSLLLASRRGAGASGMPELAAELAGAGTSVQVVACDAADRKQLAGVITGVPAAAPLTGVVHTAGVLDDGVIASLTPDRVRRVMRPKADAAWHLHELTRHLDLDTFVLFSSIAGVWGNPGQANYAAGNTFLDALAVHRRRQGLPAVSLAWGPWEQGMAGALTDAERQRMGRQGLRPLSDADGLALLDAAAVRPEPLLVTARLDLAALRRLGPAVPALATGLVRPGRRTAGNPGPDAGRKLASRLAALPPEQLAGAILNLVLTQAALVLGRPGPESIESARYFRQLGFDSLTAVEFRNRISSAVGLRLPAGVVFDYPTPVELAGYLRDRIADQEIDYEPVLNELDRLKSLLSGIAQRGGNKSKIMNRLETLMDDFRGGDGDGDDGGPADEDISQATDDEMFDLIDKELGI
ncbi:SDR family NAD(P)-dependent oxidoreductase [Streptomyces sp. NPDC020800]|uniref:SDR family NAD(P)-dependent oxidoreductase n=1 Tax=Streptomyces sp. NPDC020800 TaxID=3365092 RepID=UPI0037A3F403